MKALAESMWDVLFGRTSSHEMAHDQTVEREITKPIEVLLMLKGEANDI